MENYKRKSIELIMGLAVNEKKNPAVIPYIPAKTSASKDEKKSLSRKIGGKGGKYSRHLLLMLSELEAEVRANVHNIMVIKDGDVICEASYPGYDVNTYHLSHSMSKTVIGIAVGILIDGGLLTLSERIVDIFPEIPYKDPRFADITVEHLLAMKSGVPFAEIGSVTEDKWSAAFFGSELSFAPGEAFEYNSMNSYILSMAVIRITKRSLSSFISEKLFSPLGIDNYLWELSPEGYEKGGFGLYLSAESYAKIGIMLKDGGTYNGYRILSSEFVSEMIKNHAIAKDSKNGFNYGYHVWTDSTDDRDDKSSFLLNGMLGQNVYVNKKYGIIVSLNSGNNEVFTDSSALEIIKKYVSCLNEDAYSSRSEFKALKNKMKSFSERRHWIRPKKKISSFMTVLGLKDSTPFDKNWEPILGEYAFPDNNIGMLPGFISVFQNNYIGGIEKIRLTRCGKELILTSTEGGIAYEIPVGLYDFRESVIDFKGEKYKIRAIAEAMEDEDRVPVYKIELIFPELPNTRRIKITHASEGIRLRMSEIPNQNVAAQFISSFLESGKMGLAFGFLEKRMGEDFISKKLTAAFNPELFGIDTRISGWESIIASLNFELSQKRENENKFIKSAICKFLGDSKDEKKKEERKKEEENKSGNFLSKALSSLFSKFIPPFALSDENSD